MASLFEDIKTHLKTATSVTDLVGSGDRARIYLDWIKQGVTPPFIRIEIFEGERFPHLTAQVGLTENRVQVDCYGTTIEQAKTLADAVRNTEAVDNTKGQMGHFKGTMGGRYVHGCVSVDSYRYESDPPPPGHSDPRFFVSQDFVIHHNEATT